MPKIITGNGLERQKFIVGSSSQVTEGNATHSSITSAISDAPVGSKITVLAGTYTENLSVSKQVIIEGEGYASVLSGTMTFTSAGSSSYIRGLNIRGDLSIPLGSDNIFIRDCWLITTATVSDFGSSNSVLIIQE